MQNLKLVENQRDLTNEQRDFLDEFVYSCYSDVESEIKELLINDEYDRGKTILTVYDEMMEEVAFQNSEEIEEEGIDLDLFLKMAWDCLSATDILESVNEERVQAGKSELDYEKLC